MGPPPLLQPPMLDSQLPPTTGPMVTRSSGFCWQESAHLSPLCLSCWLLAGGSPLPAASGHSPLPAASGHFVLALVVGLGPPVLLAFLVRWVQHSTDLRGIVRCPADVWVACLFMLCAASR